MVEPPRLIAGLINENDLISLIFMLYPIYPKNCGSLGSDLGARKSSFI